MATRSNIGILKDGKIRAIYSHYDGYPSGVGKTLRDHYTDIDKIEELINLGNVSSLDKNITRPEGHSFNNRIDGYSLFYERDRGDDGQEARMYDSLDEVQYNDYTYIWDYEKGKWFFTDNFGDKRKVDLATADLDKFEKCGLIKQLEKLDKESEKHQPEQGYIENYEAVEFISDKTNLDEEAADEMVSVAGDMKYEGYISIYDVRDIIEQQDYAKGGEIDEYYSKMIEKLGKKGAFERVLKDSGFNAKNNQPKNELHHNRGQHIAIITDEKVYITKYSPNTKRFLNSQTLTSPKELAEYLDKNQIYAEGGMTGPLKLAITPNEFSPKVEEILDEYDVLYRLDPDYEQLHRMGEGKMYIIEDYEEEDLEDAKKALSMKREGVFTFYKGDDPADGDIDVSFYKKGGKVSDNKELITGGILGILLGIFLNK